MAHDAHNIDMYVFIGCSYPDRRQESCLKSLIGVV